MWHREKNRSTRGEEPASGVQIADKFEHFLDAYRRPDGSRWGGQDLHGATGGVVTRSWVNVQNYKTPELRFHALLTEDGDQRVGVAKA